MIPQASISSWLANKTEKVWFSNINWEQNEGNAVQLFPSVKNKAIDALVSQMDAHQLLLAHAEDTVMVSHQVDPYFLEYLTQAGIQLPKVIIGSMEEHTASIRGKTILPYLVDEKLESFLQKQKCTMMGPSAALSLKLNHKLRTRSICEANQIPVTEGQICSNADELKDAYLHYSHGGDSRVVIKTGYGSSGKGMYHVRSTSQFDSLMLYLARKKDIPFEVSLETWHPTEMTLNAQLLILKGKASLLAITQQQLTSTGIYEGSHLYPHLPASIHEEYLHWLTKIGDLLVRLGYEGVIGIDSIVDSHKKIIPVVEFNARLTMVTYLLSLREKAIERGFTHIHNCYFDVECTEQYNFKQWQAMLLHGGITTEHMLIYGFHVHQKDESYYYRMFVMLWGTNAEQLEESKQHLTNLMQMLHKK
ncbi:hypothetical protein [Longirhabdus pacifica]|uniref:hypothetical protein n=1 Tax=Longirhabdus pacifica TaxID=2305227 RepID=UPI0010089EBC|nr:hypothetical protein [Longirhabdus pacifica]